MFFHAAENDAPIVRKEALVGLAVLAPTLNEVDCKSLINLLCVIVDKESSKEVR